MDRLNKWITRYLALEAIYVIFLAIFLFLIWIFREQLLSPYSWLTIRGMTRYSANTFLEITLSLACLGNVIAAVITLWVLLRKDRPAITLNNFLIPTINLIMAIVVSPIILDILYHQAFASRAIGKYF